MRRSIPTILLKIPFILWLFCWLISPFEIRGFYYENLTYKYFTPVHVLTVDPKEDVIVPVRASGDEVARETVTVLAKRYGANAAVNGGFFSELTGKPSGILKISHHWYGTPVKPRGAIGWSFGGQRVLIDRVLTNCQLKDCPDNDAIEVIPASNPPYTTSEEWKELEHIVGGTPVLIKNGNVIEDFSPEKTIVSFLINRHPRTAVGIKENGEWVFVVVDGRIYGFLGMTMKELAALMLELDCVEALNLDGGGSSTMVIEGSVINESCGEILEAGKFVEAVSDAILIYSQAQ